MSGRDELVIDNGALSWMMVQGPLAAAIPVITMVASTAASVVGMSAQAQGIQQEAANAQALGQYQQAQLAQEADTSVSMAQRKADEQRRRGQLMQSQLVARGAGSGLDTTMGSASDLSQQIAGRSEYSSLMDLSKGQDMAAGYMNQGAGDLYQGKLDASLVPERLAGTYASGASSIASTLGKFNFG